MAGLVSGLDLSWGWTCPKTSGPDLSKSFRAGNVPNFRAGSVSGQTWFAAGLVLELTLNSVCRFQQGLCTRTP